MRLHADVPVPPVIMDGVQVAARPDCGLIVGLRVTVALNPGPAAMVVAKLPVLPAGTSESLEDLIVNVVVPVM